MSSRLIACAFLSASAWFLNSCGSDSELPIMAGNTQAAAGEGEELYQVAKQADDSGKTGKAIKLYDETATRFPFAPSAPQARFRQAQLLEQQGDILESLKLTTNFSLVSKAVASTAPLSIAKPPWRKRRLMEI
ncbi:MAG: hypothetical protein HC767_11765 [Akkermansiaceae bacterium]|nr:hypothetical protein [Akkermansiaceae bacterium]